MASKESIFLFEIAVDELKSFDNSTNHRIRANFGDIFTLKLKDPNEFAIEIAAQTTRQTRQLKRKRKGRKKGEADERPLTPEVPATTALIASDAMSLHSHMTNSPLELILINKDDPYSRGLAEVPWTSTHLDYLKEIDNDPDLPPAILRNKYKVYDEYTSKRVAIVKLRIKLSYMKEYVQVAAHPYNQNMGPDWNPSKLMNAPEDIGIVKTVYTSGRPKREYTRRKPTDIPILDEDDSYLEVKDTSIRYKSKNTKEVTNGETKERKRKKHKSKQIEPAVPKIEVEIPKVEVEEKQSQIYKTSQDPEALSLPYSSSPTHECLTIMTTQAIPLPFYDSVTEDREALNTIFVAPNKQETSFTEEEKKERPLENKNTDDVSKTKKSLVCLVRSQTEIEKTTQIALTRHWSSSSIEIKQRLDTLNYIFGNIDGPFGNQVYCVGYFTVESEGGGGGNVRAKSAAETPSKGDTKYSFTICEDDCRRAIDNPCFENTQELDLPIEAARYIKVKECRENVTCDYKERPYQLLEGDPDPVLITFEGPTEHDCCLEKVEEIVGGTVLTKMTHGEDPCLCTCECTFGFVKKTTYCAICGGYEIPGDEVVGKEGQAPFPCPVYHKLTDKLKKGAKVGKSKSVEEASGRRGASSVATSPDEKRSGDSDRESTKKKRKQKDERFKFNYGYKGIPPTIGHSQCALPCTGTMNPVPKNMGWLWTADNIPGLKPRPGWKPGAANKYVVRQLRIARFPEQELKKRKKKEVSKKRSLKRPLLVVEKKDGEYYVTMETMKSYAKPRTINQAPYEEKPVISYVIGRTEEENKERAKRKARAQRRLEREQRAFIQSTFADMCKEICLKTYQQALGLMPFSDDPICSCFPAIEPPPDRIDESHSCSCTDSERSSLSATDDDEWLIEFTPPNAFYDPTYKGKRPLKVNNETQYSYLDFRVKTIDRFGNQVPRFFIGPDGKRECSDLGGFWKDKKWLEINVDGIIGDDGRWQPHSFIGPCGEQVDAEMGKFQATNGVWLMAGVDGYVDTDGKWRFYSKKPDRNKDPKKQQVKNIDAWVKAGGCKVTEGGAKRKFGGGGLGLGGKVSEATWSCFGNASPRGLSHMGIVGHGHDRRLLLSTLEQLLAQGENVKIPQPHKAPKINRKRKEVRRVSLPERAKCRHKPPPTKGILAVNDFGHKTYFRLQDSKNLRPQQRLRVLDEEGISLSSYHVPCFSSFINSEEQRQKMLAHIQQHNQKVMHNMGVGY